MAASGRIFPNWIRAFVEYASYSEAPFKTLFWVGVSSIAGALRRKVWIDQKYFQWIPNFYIVIVAPPGVVSKSTTINIGMSLLREVPGINFGPDVVTWQALIQSLSASKEAFNPPGTDIFIPMSAVTVASSEFGTFLDLNDRSMVDILVDLWDGRQVFEKVTKTSGSDRIENIFMNIIACTTPAWIASNFPEYMIGGGFMSRCIFVYADEKRQLVPYPEDSVPAEFVQMREDLIRDLEHISLMCGQVELSVDAKAWGVEWYKKLWTERPPHLADEMYGGYVSRRQTHLHKLAIVLAASKGDNLLVTRAELEEAEQILLETENDISVIFSRVGQSDSSRGAGDIVHIVHSFGRIPVPDIYKRLFRTMSYREFQDALNSAVQAGHIRLLQQGQTMIAEKVGGN